MSAKAADTRQGDRHKAKPASKVYLLRDIDPDLWRRARSRAVLEGLTIREVILELLESWAPEGGFVGGMPRLKRRK